MKTGRYDGLLTMAHLTARTLPFPEAREHADLFLITQDLKHCGWCCNFFLDRNDYINTHSCPYDRAIFDSMVVSYRRCFTTGIRDSLKSIPLEEILEEDIKYHRLTLDIASQHVAHSVNRMEEWSTGLNVAVLEDGTIANWRGLREGGTGVAGMSLHEVDSLRRVLYRLLLFYIYPRREELKRQLLALTSQMTLDDVRNLPDGLHFGTRGREHLSKRKR